MSSETLDYKRPVLEKKNGSTNIYQVHSKGDYYGNNGKFRNTKSRDRKNENVLSIKMIPFSSDTNKYAFTNLLDFNKLPSSIILDKNIFSKNRIQEVIDEAQILLSYKDDWDDNGAIATDNNTFEIASKTLLKISEKLIDSRYSIEVPFIDLTVNGGISLKWENDKAQLFIIFEKGETQFAYFYGECKNKELPSCYKSGIDLTRENVDSVLLAWIKENLSKYEPFITK